MCVRVSIGAVVLDAYPGSFALSVDDLEYDGYGHSDGTVLILRTDGKVEFGYIGGDTDVDAFQCYSPRQTWSSFTQYTTDEDINDVPRSLDKAFRKWARTLDLSSFSGLPPG